MSGTQNLSRETAMQIEKLAWKNYGNVFCKVCGNPELCLSGKVIAPRAQLYRLWTCRCRMMIAHLEGLLDITGVILFSLNLVFIYLSCQLYFPFFHIVGSCLHDWCQNKVTDMCNKKYHINYAPLCFVQGVYAGWPIQCIPYHHQN